MLKWAETAEANDVEILDRLKAELRARGDVRPAIASWRSKKLADLELDRPWYERMRDAWLTRVAERGLGGQ